MSESQIDRLANFIMAEVPGEPSQSEGAGDTAIRVIRRLTAALRVHGRHADECALYPCSCWLGRALAEGESDAG